MAFGFGKKTTTHTDDTAWTAVKSDNTVRTTPVAVNYRPVSEGEITAMERNLDARKRASSRFKRYLALLMKWEVVDADDTVELANYQAEVAKSLVTKQGALAAKQVEIEKLRLPQARMAKKLQDTRVSVDAAIANLHHKQEEIASKNGWDK